MILSRWALGEAAPAVPRLWQTGTASGGVIDKVPQDSVLALYLAHRRALVNYANGIVGDLDHAEEVVQEAWLRFGRVAGGRPLEEPVGYLYRIVRNLAIDDYRRRLREARVLQPDADKAVDSVSDEAPSPEAAAAAKDELRRLLDAMAELPERTRIALEMRRFGGCKLKEIAAHLGISVTVAHEIVAEGLAHCRRRVRPGP
ncbi:sigma-70 family RNA polymerase sigma factor [Algihabitans albus]|uniref:sigma-70 family RNA polymerase sigma factor n=1 Tax=Algihabitans albus TaxID=2164067 RepID=UPI0035CEB87C